MKALTVQQPWAWAIIHGGKDVENRTQAWGYRGPLAIHAGARWSERGEQTVLRLTGQVVTASPMGAIIGVVDLIDVHRANPRGRCDCPTPLRDGWHSMSCSSADFCCPSDWAESSYAEHGGSTRRDVVHLVLEHPRALPEPIPCRGALGLWTPPADVLDQLRAVA